MDKLRPVLKQLFWISTGFVILLAVCGWWMAMGSLHEQIEKDTKKVAAADTSSQAGKNTASAAWTAAAKEVNEADRLKFEEAEAGLHRRQQKYRTYPEKIEKELKRESFGKAIEDTALRGEYGKLYEGQFLEQLKVLDPFIVQDNKGVIDVDVDEITMADTTSWPNLRPSSAELWMAQEDLWLLRSLFESISAANEGAERLGKSPVRQLKSLYMRGGSPDGAPDSGSSGSSGRSKRGRDEPEETWSWDAPGGGGKKEEDDKGDTEAVAGGFGGGMNAGSSFSGDLASDLLTEEFGPDPSGGRLRRRRGGSTRERRGRFGSDGGGLNIGIRGSLAGLRNSGGGSSFGIGAGGGAQKPATASIEKQLAVRYVHNEDGEYRTRAFLLHVRVHHAHLPVLLAELTNSSFPVEIVRVNAQFWGQGEESGRGGKPKGRARQNDDEGGLLSNRRSGALGNRGGGARRGGPQATGLLAKLANKHYDPMLAEQGESQRRTALADPALAEVKIAGLMTIYRSKEENAAVEETAEAESPKEDVPAASPEGADPGEAQPGAPAAASEDAGSESPDDGENADSPQDAGDGQQAAGGDAAGEDASEADGGSAEPADAEEAAP